jgi:hypothetical protein
MSWIHNTGLNILKVILLNASHLVYCKHKPKSVVDTDPHLFWSAGSTMELRIRIQEGLNDPQRKRLFILLHFLHKETNFVVAP